MCLMHTDLPVPDGPRIIEILFSGMPMFRPRRILLRPNALWTSTNSTASSTPLGRFLPVCHLYSSSSCGCVMSPPDRCAWIRTPEHLGAEHADQVDQHDVQNHGFRGRGAYAHRPAARRIAVVTADEDDRGGHDHRLYQAEYEVRWVLEHPEDQGVAPAGHFSDLLDHGQVGREEPGAD